MKVDARRVAGFLAKPGACRLVLLHGDDAGLVRQHADTLTRAVGGSLDDPFRVAVLERDMLGRLEEEAGALSLMGGRRVVRVREAGEAVLAPVRRALERSGDTLLLLEAPGLGRGKLRSFVEAWPDGAAIACYPEEGRALEETIRMLLVERDVVPGRGVVEWLAGQLGSDHQATRAEVEKLALYVGPGAVVELDAAQACVGDSALLHLDEALFAATAGDLGALDRTLERAMAEGVNAIAVIRPALSHLQRLHQARLLVADGMAAADAVRMVRPPVFFRRVPAFTRALSLWSPGALLRAIEEARLVEQACKTTGARMDALCRRFLSVLARQAAQGRHGS
ncbi:MAG: DNA polymerase III subunit delta [Janthinobacterium lividum]